MARGNHLSLVIAESHLSLHDPVLRLGQARDSRVVDAEVRLNDLRGREGEPLREADVLELGCGGTERQGKEI